MIENISEQIKGYSQEVRDCIKEFMAEGFSFDESAAIVKLGIDSINADVKFWDMKYKNNII